MTEAQVALNKKSRQEKPSTTTTKPAIRHARPGKRVWLTTVAIFKKKDSKFGKDNNNKTEKSF